LEHLTFDWTEELLILINIAIAVVLTGCIGLNKPAGFRTNMIVGASSALILSLGQVLIENYTQHELQLRGSK
jgi:putative Mg2+ transporter-C (MgtC) family protein